MAVPQELVDDFVHGRASVFVGAGLSAGLGLLTWNELTQRLARDLGPEWRAKPALEVAQRYRDRFGAPRLTELLIESLTTLDAAPLKSHETLVGGLHLDHIFTTNFDDILEEACRKVGRPPHVAFDSGTYGLFPHGFFRVIKLHGHLHAPESIVLASVDYDNFMATHPAMATAIEEAFRTRTIVFIGYGFGDPDIRRILERVRTTTGAFARPHYIVSVDPDSETVLKHKREGLTVVPCPTAGGTKTEAVVTWLDQLQRAVAKQRPLHADDDESASMPERSANLVGRDAKRTEVLNALDMVRAVVITGEPGVGKTCIALDVAHRWVAADARGRRKIVWFAAREHEARSGWLNELLDQIGSQLHHEYIGRHPADDIEWKMVEAKSALTEPTMLVLDNMETVGQTEAGELWAWLLTIPIQSRVLLTGRPEITETSSRLGFHVVHLMGLADADAAMLIDRFANRGGHDGVLNAERNNFPALARITRGNPELLRLACSAIEHRIVRFDQLDALRTIPSDVDRLFEELLTLAWTAPDAGDMRRVMMCTPLFVSSTIPHRILTHVAGLTGAAARAATDRAVELGLLEPTRDERRYFVHPRVREFAAASLKRDRAFERRVRAGCAERYLRFVKGVVEGGRSSPAVPYWRALVSEAMHELDHEWPMIRAQMEWALGKDPDLLRDFVMMLVHYMDSRCLNPDRIRYTAHVVDHVPNEECPEDCSVLRLDALAWTYLEECKLDEAWEQVERGRELALLMDEGAEQLVSLATAWSALITARRGDLQTADATIRDALRIADTLEPWIRMRLYMAAGDIALMRSDAADACASYCKAQRASEEYGDDGLGYQIHPRIGLAMTMLPDRLNEAQSHFDGIRGRGVPSGTLYADYGLGLVEIARGWVDKGRARIRATRERLEQRRASSLIADLMDVQYGRLDPEGAAALAAAAPARSAGVVTGSF